MKSKRYTLLAILLVLILLASAAPVSAKTTRVEFTGNEACDDPLILKEWMSGPNYHANGITSTCYDTASIPELTGTDYLTDGRMKFVGPNFILVGTLRMESAEGGVWKGSWVLPANSTTIQVTGHGEGKYEGMELHWFLSLDGPFWGYIVFNDK